MSKAVLPDTSPATRCAALLLIALLGGCPARTDFGGAGRAADTEGAQDPCGPLGRDGPGRDAAGPGPADASEPASDSEPDVVGLDSVVVPASDAGRDAASPADLGMDSRLDEGTAWVLPACDRACDRVTRCGVLSCPGYDWSTSGLLFDACFSACDPPFAESVLGAGGCDEVLREAMVRIPNFAEVCESSPCEQGCALIARCVVSECPGIDPDQEQELARGCLSDCHGPNDVSWVLEGRSCAEMVATISRSDPDFARWCSGEPPVCAGVQLCDPYARKITTCMLDHCVEEAAAYEPGLVAVFLDYCLHGDPCPSRDSVEAVLDPELGCDDPPLDQVGLGPPFTGLCLGESGVGPEQTREACLALMACPGMDWFGIPELCMVLLAIRDDAALRIDCLLQAEDCRDIQACLEDM